MRKPPGQSTDCSRARPFLAGPVDAGGFGMMKAPAIVTSNPSPPSAPKTHFHVVAEATNPARRFPKTLPNGAPEAGYNSVQQQCNPIVRRTVGTKRIILCLSRRESHS
jgi:hypothetical protein